MKQMGFAGVIRGRPVKTTVSNPAAPCPRDGVNRQFRAAKPNALWVSDFTYVATWQGFVYVAFVIDVFARRNLNKMASGKPGAVHMAEAFVRTFKRDYVRVNPIPDARSLISQLPAWFRHYNNVHPHKALRYRSPVEFIRATLIT
jgi:transposase InsO family protein